MFSVDEQKNFSRPDPVQVPADEVVCLHFYHYDQGRKIRLLGPLIFHPQEHATK